VVDLVKLVKPDMTTFGGQGWAIGWPVVIPLHRRRPQLCSGGVLHAYRSLDLALLAGPAHGYSDSAVVLAAVAPEIAVDDGVKVGVYALTPTRQIERPAWWADVALRRRVQVRFAVLCARSVLDLFERYRPDDDRPRRAIEAAETLLSGGSDDAAAAALAAFHAVNAPLFDDAAEKAAYAARDVAQAAYFASNFARAGAGAGVDVLNGEVLIPTGTGFVFVDAGSDAACDFRRAGCDAVVANAAATCLGSAAVACISAGIGLLDGVALAREAVVREVRA
jgi:hypothetical protein